MRQRYVRRPPDWSMPTVIPPDAGRNNSDESGNARGRNPEGYSPGWAANSGRGQRAVGYLNGGRNPLHLRNESIAPPRQGLDISRLIRSVPQCVTQSLYSGVDAVIEFDDGGIRPEASPYLVAGHHVSLPFEQHPQDLERLLRQADACTALTQFAKAYVQLKGSETNVRRTNIVHPVLLTSLRKQFNIFRLMDNFSNFSAI